MLKNFHENIPFYKQMSEVYKLAAGVFKRNMAAEERARDEEQQAIASGQLVIEDIAGTGGENNHAKINLNFATQTNTGASIVNADI